MPSEYQAKKNQYELIARLCDGDKKNTNPATKALASFIDLDTLQRTYERFGHIYGE
jgi:hypothetical protein